MSRSYSVNRSSRTQRKPGQGQAATPHKYTFIHECGDSRKEYESSGILVRRWLMALGIGQVHG
jgi:hypothetical protein